MSLIQIHAPFASPSLPLDVFDADVILARPSLRSWWTSDPALITLEAGAVASIAQLAGAANLPLYQATAGQRPLLEDAALGLYPAITLDGANDYLRTSAIPYTKNGPFSWVWMGKVPPFAANQNIAAIFNTSGESTLLRVNTASSTVVFQHGSGSVSVAAAVSGGHFDAPLLIVGSSDGAALNLRVNDAVAAPVATNNAQTASTFVVGAANTSALQPAAMKMGDLMIFQEDIHADTDFLHHIANYARKNYAAPVSVGMH